MSKIIGILQLKGGVGRSTIATNLAGELSRANNVALLDCDMPQGTSASWAAIRYQVKPNQKLSTDTVSSHPELVDKVEALQGKTDFIILDSPPRIATMARALLMLADLTIIPVGVSAAEVWACSDVMELLKEAREIREVEAYLLWSRYRSYTRLAQELHTDAEKELGLPAMKTTLGYRTAYAEALGRGLTVGELKDPSARRELVSLVVEVKRKLKGKT